MARFEDERLHLDESMHIPDILSFFSVGHMRDFTKLDGGTANLNYLIVTERNEEFIVKFAKNQTQESLLNDRAIGAQLKAVGISSPQYLQRSDGKFIYNEGPIAVVWPRIEGVHPEPIDEDVSYAIGDVLARFHGAVTTLPNHREAWLNPIKTAKLIKQEDHPLTKQAQRYLAEGVNIYDYSLPSGVIHGDLDLNNLLVRENDHTKIVALLDFEEAEKNVYIADIARTLVRICATDSGTKLDQNLMREFLKGYSSVRHLTREELENLPNAMKWVTGAAMLWYIENNFPQDAQSAIDRVESLF